MSNSRKPTATRWSLPAPGVARLYNVLTVLFAIPCCFVFVRLMVGDINGSGVLDGVGLVVGGGWLVVPILALAGVTVANLPSTGEHMRAWLSALALGGLLLLALLPLALIFLL